MPLLEGEIHLAPLISSATAAEACLNLGALQYALDLAESGLSRAREARNSPFEAAALRIRGRVLAAPGQWTEGEADLAEAEATFRQMGLLFDLARTLLHLGALQLGRGGEEGRARVQEALAIFEQLGAAPYIQKARQALGLPNS